MKLNMKNKYRIMGWTALVVSILALILGTILRKSGYGFAGALVPTIFGAGVVLSAMWLSAGHSEKASKQFDADRKDERTQLIRGKSAVTAMFTMLILLLVLGVWLATQEYIANAFAVFGIFFIGLLIFIIKEAILEKKM